MLGGGGEGGGGACVWLAGGVCLAIVCQARHAQIVQRMAIKILCSMSPCLHNLVMIIDIFRRRLHSLVRLPV